MNRLPKYTTKGFTLIRLLLADARRSCKGFTLIELLIAVSIMIVLMAIGWASLSQILRGSRDGKRQSDLKSIQTAIEQYHADYGYYPQKSLLTFTANQSFSVSGRTYLNKIPLDPNTSWKQYCYEPQPSGCSTSACITYFLYAKLEISTGATTYSGCSNSDYNLQLSNP
jgi:prepilin-type N-terminal cleavage/methylation domain-containing protein